MSQSLRLRQMDHKRGYVKQTENPARNLRRADLGSVIFGCKNATMKECMFKQLFGLPAPHYTYVRNVGPGMPLFLFNYSDRTLHGVFEATSEGQMNINKYAWTFDGDDATQFPAQVKVGIRKQYRPLTEEQFKPIIAKNYYEGYHFYFELDKAQTHRMLALFKEPRAPQISSRQHSPSVHKSTKSLERSSANLTTSSTGQPWVEKDPLHKQNEQVTCYNEKSWCSLFKAPPESKAIKDQETVPSSSLCKLDSSSKADMDWESMQYSDGEIIPDEIEDQICEWAGRNGGMQLDNFAECCEENLLAGEGMTAHSNLSPVVSDDEIKTVLSENSSHHSSLEWGLASAVGSHYEQIHDPSMQKPKPESSKANSVANMSDVAEEERVDHCSESLIPGFDEADNLSCIDDIIYSMTLSDLQSFTIKFLHAMEKSKSSQLIQELINHSLKEDKVQAKTENETLKESQSYLSTGLIDEEQFTKSLYPPSNFGHSILLAGGYDGSSFLPTLDSFYPSVDHIRSLNSMSVVRPYATSVQVNNELYMLGGGDGNLWHDTVESYSLRNDSWVYCPSLKKKKGSLSGIGSGNKIFAIGGGDGEDCFSDVEMLDLAFGNWITIPSMLEKRFASAAAELKGRMYVIGGYDGKTYLNTMEGLDPRERSWTRLRSMHKRRGCHCVTILNEKLYAIGGYDGAGMVTSVEAYDPRLGSWMMADSLNIARGYFGAATIGSAMYSIGGITDSGEGLASFECYSEGLGWQLSTSETLGKRSAFSAVAATAP